MRKDIAIGVSVAVALAVVFFVPVAQVNFSEPPGGYHCSNISACAHVFYLGQGYASIAYWLFGTGGLYDSTMNRYYFVY